jgi:hypothetical protein
MDSVLGAVSGLKETVVSALEQLVGSKDEAPEVADPHPADDSNANS